MNFQPLVIPLAICASLHAAPPQKATIHIISPVNGTVLRPGKKLAVKITGRGALHGVLLTTLSSNGPMSDDVFQPSGKPPWIVPLEIPLSTEPGPYSLVAASVEGALGTAPEGEGVSNEVQIDIEPAAIPPVTFSESAFTIPAISCITLFREDSPTCAFHLFITGTYPDGTEVSLHRSTRLDFVSEDPAIVKVWKNGAALVGLSPGSTRISVLGKYTLDVTVLPRR